MLKKYFILNSYQKYFIHKHWLAYSIMLIMAVIFACFNFSLGYGYNFLVFFLYIIALLLTLSVVANFDYSNIVNIKIVNVVYHNLNKIIEIMKINVYINMILFILPWLVVWFEFFEKIFLNFSGSIFIYSIFICIRNMIAVFSLRNDTIKRIYEERTQIKTEIMRNDQ